MTKRVRYSTLYTRDGDILSEAVFAIATTIAEAFSCVERLWPVITHEEICASWNRELLAFFCTSCAVVGETSVAIFLLQVIRFIELDKLFWILSRC